MNCYILFSHPASLISTIRDIKKDDYLSHTLLKISRNGERVILIADVTCKNRWRGGFSSFLTLMIHNLSVAPILKYNFV